MKDDEIWSEIDNLGNTRWRSRTSGLQHRLDGPAIIFENGEKQWLFHGKWHRINGPAIDLSGISAKSRMEYLKRNNLPEIDDDDNYHRDCWFYHGQPYLVPDEIHLAPLEMFLGYVKWKRDRERV